LKLYIISLISLLHINTANAENWYSIARHGECVPLSFLAKKLPEFKGVNTPEELINNYFVLGHNAKKIDMLTKYGNKLTQEEMKKLPAKNTAYAIIVDKKQNGF
jgi:hypothetical protein